MTDLVSVLSRLNLLQYIDKFCEEGFETWETVLDITESDLEALGVKLGHRRILQKEIANARGLNHEQVSRSTSRAHTSDSGHGGGRREDNKTDARSNTGVGGKRKYRRHPKPDENAPERPPSAYVIFSNKIREVLKPEGLSFTDTAKKVGERWQDLPAADKELYESEATAAKEKYHAQMLDYKTTKSYQEYQQYLAEFKAKNASNLADGKRTKIAKQEDSCGSIVSQPDASPSRSSNSELGFTRRDSMGSGGPYSTTSGLPSPAKLSRGPAQLHEGLSSFLLLGNATSNPTSPSAPSMRKDSSADLFPQDFDIRPSIETHSERAALRYGHGATPRASALEERKATSQQQTAPVNSFNAGIDPRLPIGGRFGPANPLRRSTRVPPFLYHDTSDSSSKSSITSSLSGFSVPSTASSSLQYSDTLMDDGPKASLSLPPLSTVGLSATGEPVYVDSALRPVPFLGGSARQAASTYPVSQSSQSSYIPSSAPGKFESLQLPLPHNISFGQRPLPRPANEEKLANIFDLQDMPRESSSMRNLSLKQQQGSVTPTTLQGLPEPQDPPHQPKLPELPPVTSRDHGTPDPPVLHSNADPLSVLAYAGRMVARDYRPPS
ncbi:hypothetical protein P7C71_g130, partial [Lecanoromycetidae sp. Uapishka_2]